jgi:hypothetical protein
MSYASAQPLFPQNKSLTQGQSRRVSRWQASAAHLFISVSLALTVLLAMRWIWYPGPHFEAMGGKDLLFILIGVDIVIGPLITLIIFNTKKKSLRFDLAIVALLQLAALAYGVHAMFEARPIYVVYTKDRFDVVTAKDILPEELAKVTRKEYKSLPLFGPKLVGIAFPSEAGERNRILFSAAGGGGDLQTFPQHYVSFEEQLKEVLSHAKPLTELIRLRPTAKAEIQVAVNAKGRKLENVLFLPVRAKNKDFTALIDAETGFVIDYILVDPWN